MATTSSCVTNHAVKGSSSDKSLPKMSGADIEAALVRAKLRAVSNQREKVTSDDIKETLADFMPPSYPIEVELQTLVAVAEYGWPLESVPFIVTAAPAIGKPVVLVRKIVHQDDRLGMFYCERERPHLCRALGPMGRIILA